MYERAIVKSLLPVFHSKDGLTGVTLSVWCNLCYHLPLECSIEEQEKRI